MRVIAKRTIVEFYTKNAASKIALEDWYIIVCKADWNGFSEVKNTFNTADFVGNERFVFNIKGNYYRLVAKILFVPQIMYIRFIGTHSEYDKITDIKNI